MRKYWLSTHAYFCFTAGQCVWLHVAKDEYFKTSGQQCAHLRDVIEGWSGSEPDEGYSNSTPEGERLAASLFDCGLLTRNARRGKAASLAQMEAPLEALIPDDSTINPEYRWSHICNFIWACLTTFGSLKLISMRLALSALEHKKKRAKRREDMTDLERMRRLVAIFFGLRKFIYTARLCCLFDSLVLARFLSLYGYYPMLIIGVHADPFRAHCWLQQGCLTFNSEPEFTKRFTPILTV